MFSYHDHDAINDNRPAAMLLRIEPDSGLAPFL